MVVDMQGGYDAEMDARGNVVVEGWARRNFSTTTDYTPQSKVIAVIGLAFVTLSKGPNLNKETIMSDNFSYEALSLPKLLGNVYRKPESQKL